MMRRLLAELAQLVERGRAKAEVVGSSPAFRLVDRRDFLRRVIGASAIAIINPAELLELLEPKRLIFPSIELVQPIAYTKVSELAKLYRRTTTPLYRVYSRRVDEYSWFNSVPDEVIRPLGREVRIPIDLVKR